ncbi:MAG: hypothetical protein II039_09670 [Treponema sp.]|nr:hypothetical protein [Treponema sp.]
MNGTNYAFLCETSIAAPDSQDLYAIVCLYEDSDKNVRITDVNLSEIRTYTDAAMGGWTRAKDPTVTKELKNMFNDALSGILGANYSPVALLSTQSGSGTNYCFFCESGKITGEPNASYAFVYIYRNADGEVSLSDILNFIGN